MRIGFIGLGRMGEAMVLHALEGGIDVVAYNRTREKTEELKSKIQNPKSNPPAGGQIKSIIQNFGNLTPTYSVKELVKQLQAPRTIWLMVPQGEPVTQMIDQLVNAGLQEGDTIIDGGNCFYKDSIRHFEQLKVKGIHYLDVGTSGGIEGARNGACLMIGGEKEVYERLIWLWEVLSGKNGLASRSLGEGGYAYFGPAGAGHFVKMVHNGVEYGMLQSIGEGFELLQKAPFQLDLYKIASNWTHGSIVRGWLMELLARALKDKRGLEEIEGVVGGGTTGKWTVEVAKELGVDTPIIEGAIKAREKSVDTPTFSGKVVAALRNMFGGHEIKKSK